jgi:hypothetical protein
MSASPSFMFAYTVTFLACLLFAWEWFQEKRRADELADKVRILELWANSEWDAVSMPAPSNSGHKSHG